MATLTNLESKLAEVLGREHEALAKKQALDGSLKLAADEDLDEEA